MAVFIQDRYHPYHNLLANYDDLQLILSYSQLSTIQYQQLVQLLQTKLQQQQFQDKITTLQQLSSRALRETINNVVDENGMEEETDFTDFPFIEELRSFASHVKFIEVKEEKIVLPPSPIINTSILNFTPSRLSFPSAAGSSHASTSQAHHIVPLLPLPLTNNHHNTHNTHNTSNHNPFTPPTSSSLSHHASPARTCTFHSAEASVEESYRIAFQYHHHQIQLQYDVRKTSLGLIESARGMVLMKSLQPSQICEYSVSIQSLPNLLELQHVRAKDLALLFSVWFEGVFEGRAQPSWMAQLRS